MLLDSSRIDVCGGRPATVVVVQEGAWLSLWEFCRRLVSAATPDGWSEQWFDGVVSSRRKDKWRKRRKEFCLA